MKRLVNLFSQDQDMFIFWSEENTTRKEINEFIINYLHNNKNDVIELCKEYSTKDTKKYFGQEIIDFYGYNKKANLVGKIRETPTKKYYISIEEN